MLRNSIFALMGAIAFAQAVPEPNQFYDVPEAYEVYSTLLEASNKPILIQQETARVLVNVRFLREQFPLAAPVIDDFVQANDADRVLDDKFRLTRPHTLLSSGQVEKMVADPANILGQAGYFILSPVGFNADKSMAMVSILHVEPGEEGKGRLAMLKKIDDVWKEMDCGTKCIPVVAGRF